MRESFDNVCIAWGNEAGFADFIALVKSGARLAVATKKHAGRIRIANLEDRYSVTPKSFPPKNFDICCASLKRQADSPHRAVREMKADGSNGVTSAVRARRWIDGSIAVLCPRLG